jgi:hypothetical protein
MEQSERGKINHCERLTHRLMDDLANHAPGVGGGIMVMPRPGDCRGHQKQSHHQHDGGQNTDWPSLPHRI